MKVQTAVRSIRMPIALANALEKEAIERRISMATLINTVLYKHVEWDIYTERFGFIDIAQNSFKNFIRKLPEDDLRQIATEVTAITIKEFISFRFGYGGTKGFLEYLPLITKYGGLGEYEIRNEGVFYNISIIHKMGEKVSMFLGFLFTELLLQLSDVKPAVNAGENEVVLKFSARV